MSFDLGYVTRAYHGSDGDVTRALYQHLATLGPIGGLAVNLMRACKNSERAKVYRGRSYKGAAYDTKQWALANICSVLAADSFGMKWGWRVDEAMIARDDPHSQVLYVELPTGQVSFHTDKRECGPDFEGEWDGVRGAAADRTIAFVGQVLGDTA